MGLVGRLTLNSQRRALPPVRTAHTLPNFNVGAEDGHGSAVPLHKDLRRPSCKRIVAFFVFS